MISVLTAQFNLLILKSKKQKLLRNRVSYQQKRNRFAQLYIVYYYCLSIMYNMQKIEEAELLKELQQGNTVAFQKLYNAYFALLYLHASRKLQDREAAKDIVHDLFASIWQNRYTLSINGAISSYLYTAIRYRVIDYIDKEKSRTNYLAALPPLSAS